MCHIGKPHDFYYIRTIIPSTAVKELGCMVVSHWSHLFLAVSLNLSHDHVSESQFIFLFTARWITAPNLDQLVLPDTITMPNISIVIVHLT